MLQVQVIALGKWFFSFNCVEVDKPPGVTEWFKVFSFKFIILGE